MKGSNVGYNCFIVCLEGTLHPMACTKGQVIRHSLYSKPTCDCCNQHAHICWDAWFQVIARVSWILATAPARAWQDPLSNLPASSLPLIEATLQDGHLFVPAASKFVCSHQWPACSRPYLHTLHAADMDHKNGFATQDQNLLLQHSNKAWSWHATGKCQKRTHPSCSRMFKSVLETFMCNQRY